MKKRIPFLRRDIFYFQDLCVRQIDCIGVGPEQDLSQGVRCTFESGNQALLKEYKVVQR